MLQEVIASLFHRLLKSKMASGWPDNKCVASEGYTRTTQRSYQTHYESSQGSWLLME